MDSKLNPDRLDNEIPSDACSLPLTVALGSHVYDA